MSVGAKSILTVVIHWLKSTLHQSAYARILDEYDKYEQSTKNNRWIDKHDVVLTLRHMPTVVTSEKTVLGDKCEISDRRLYLAGLLRALTSV